MNRNGPPAVCRTLIVKLASRCNLNCSYCYVYNRGDVSYQTQPSLMSRTTIDSLFARAAEHADQHGLKQFSFVLHGGEPLLAPDHLLSYFARAACDAFRNVCRVSIAIQTNGTLLTPAKCALLNDLRIKVGVSIDVLPQLHDAERYYHSGAGSYRDVCEGWRNAKTAGLDPGLLCVIDPSSDPIKSFYHLASFSPRIVDFLLPDANYDNMPAVLPHAGPEPYATWLLSVFDEWIKTDEPLYRIRTFENILLSLNGKASHSDGLGVGTNDILCIDTDGAIAPTDVMKICGLDYFSTGCTVANNTLDDAIAHKNVERYQYSNVDLCLTCQRCAVSEICGGGHIPHRYRKLNGFENPSIYCANLFRLIAGIVDRVMLI